MKLRVLKAVGVALMMVAVLVMFSMPVAVATDPVQMEGTYALKGRVNMYNLSGQRYKVDGEVVKCTSATLVIGPKENDSFEGTLTLQNILNTPVELYGNVGVAGRYVYMMAAVRAGPYTSITLRGRLVIRDGVVYAIKGIVIQGVDRQNKFFFGGKMRGIWSETE